MATKTDARSLMPPPPVSSSQASKRSEAKSDTTTVFSDTTKLEAIRLSSSSCWNCWNVGPEFAHVIGHRQAPVWRQAYLFPFSLKAVANCIPLCSYCHGAFDQLSDPGWVFLPSDLRFFIQFEVDDQLRLAHGVPPAHRVVPSAEQYKSHQSSQGILSSVATGGLYRGYFLEDLLHAGHLPVDLLRAFSAPKSWHGHPLASIRRGIAILGSSRLYVLDPSTIDELTTLRRLYFDNPNVVNKKLSQLYCAPSLDKKRDRDEDDSDPQLGERKHFRAGEKPADMSRHECYAETEWVLGPDSTASDAINRFALLLHSTNAIQLLG